MRSAPSDSRVDADRGFRSTLRPQEVTHRTELLALPAALRPRANGLAGTGDHLEDSQNTLSVHFTLDVRGRFKGARR